MKQRQSMRRRKKIQKGKDNQRWDKEEKSAAALGDDVDHKNGKEGVRPAMPPNSWNI